MVKSLCVASLTITVAVLGLEGDSPAKISGRGTPSTSLRARVTQDTLKCAGRYAIAFANQQNSVIDFTIFPSESEFRPIIHTYLSRGYISNITRIEATSDGCQIDLEADIDGDKKNEKSYLKLLMITTNTLVGGMGTVISVKGKAASAPITGAYVPTRVISKSTTPIYEFAKSRDNTETAKVIAPLGLESSSATRREAVRPAAATEASDDNPTLRPVGPVKLAITSVLVAPGKDSGLPWDCCGQLPDEVSRELRKPLGQKLTRELFGALGMGTQFDVLNEALPWTINAFMRGVQAPDVRVDLYIDETHVLSTEKVANSYMPTWPNAFTGPIEIGLNTQISILATDIDLSQHDRIGTCTSRGMPVIDKRAYAQGDTFECHGQLWAVALRVIPAETE